MLLLTNMDGKTVLANHYFAVSRYVPHGEALAKACKHFEVGRNELRPCHTERQWRWRLKAAER